ncbi:FAD-binding oxidoreductase [Streptomyces sp. NPDC005970]|uniref:FAD-binding oxidoreductase n=1 Tax=Streptomyces sp. NPDC005970 TaxID=3156723 RepID=UPI0033E4E52C
MTSAITPGDGFPDSPDFPDFPDFPAGFRGQVLRPGDHGYDEARAVNNGRAADEGPALIARCLDEDDVATVLRYASATRTPVAVRGGGHGYDGHAMPGGALVVDLSALRAIAVDPVERTVRAQAGVTLGDLDAATQKYGLVVPSGTVTSTGLAGLTLGGGIGHLMRRYGATVDNLLACEMVTVDGRRVRADADTEPELFWALRGGGGNFGVVTTFEYQAHQMGTQAVAGFAVYGLHEASDMLAALDGVMAEAPRELGLVATITPAPPLPMIPEQAHGRPVLILSPVFTGDPATADAVLKPLLGLSTPLANLIQPTTWLQANSMLDETAPYGKRAASRSGYLPAITAETAAAVLERAAAATPGWGGTINLIAMGGAITEDADEDATAFPRAGAAWTWQAVALWDSPGQDTGYDQWAADTAAALAPHSLPTGYVNLTTDQGEQWRRNLWGSEARFRRLRRAKGAWDPHNLLRFNKNITPAV